MSIASESLGRLAPAPSRGNRAVALSLRYALRELLRLTERRL